MLLVRYTESQKSFPIFSDRFYENVEELNEDLARCLNREILALAEAGCKHIQIDEPLIARKPQEALKYGIDHLNLCFQVCL